MAQGNGRSSIGIDLDRRNADLARERIGPLYLDIEILNKEAPPVTDIVATNTTAPLDGAEFPFDAVREGIE